MSASSMELAQVKSSKELLRKMQINHGKMINNQCRTTWWRIILFPFRVMNMVKLFKKAFWKFPLEIKMACYLDVKVHLSSSWKEEESWIQA